MILVDTTQYDSEGLRHVTSSLGFSLMFNKDLHRFEPLIADDLKELILEEWSVIHSPINGKCIYQMEPLDSPMYVVYGERTSMTVFLSCPDGSYEFEIITLASPTQDNTILITEILELCESFSGEETCYH